MNEWSSDEFVSALRHDASNPGYNLHLRQLLHVGFKVAAKMGERYLDMLKACEATVSKNVTENLYERHMKPLFIGNGDDAPRGRSTECGRSTGHEIRTREVSRIVTGSVETALQGKDET